MLSFLLIWIPVFPLSSASWLWQLSVWINDFKLVGQKRPVNHFVIYDQDNGGRFQTINSKKCGLKHIINGVVLSYFILLSLCYDCNYATLIEVWIKSKIMTIFTKKHYLLSIILQHSTFYASSLLSSQSESLKNVLKWKPISPPGHRFWSVAGVVNIPVTRCNDK